MELSPESLPDADVIEVQAGSLSEGCAVTVRGAKTGHPEVLVLIQADRLVVCRSFNALRKFVLDRNITLQLKPWSICQFLRNSYVPIPYTVFQHVYLLGFGDCLTVGPGHDLTSTAELQHEFPFFAHTSREDSPASVDDLRGELAAAVERTAGPFTDRVLMLSSGPDSGALALALADNGFDDVRCLTYATGHKADEHLAAAALCQRLGLKHETVTLSESTPRIQSILHTFFSRSLFPCADITIIPYVMCLHQANVERGICLDGLGLVVYGLILSKMNRIKLRYNVSKWLGFMQSFVPHYSRLSWFVKPEIDVWIRGYNLDPATIARIYGPAVDTERFWTDTDRLLAGYDLIDYHTATYGRHYEQARNFQKARAATSAQGVTLGLPWRDEKFSEYMFNLPEHHRFDRRRQVNKNLCRTMLREATGLDSFVTGAFQFDQQGFCERSRDFIHTEILQSALWTKDVEAVLRRLYAALPRHRFAAVAIHDMFQLSAWLNRSGLPIRH